MNFTADELWSTKKALDAYAIRLSGRQNAEDLVQQTLLHALEKQHLFEKGTNLKAWLICMMHNKYISNLKYEARRGHINLPVFEDSVTLVRDNSASTELGVLIRDVTKALDELPVIHYDVIRCITLKGMDYQECADQLSIPVGTVRSRLARAKLTLKQVVN